jgi:hypothetical protein
MDVSVDNMKEDGVMLKETHNDNPQSYKKSNVEEETAMFA